MKTKIITIILLAFTIVSCNQLLDFDPYGKVPPAKFWQNEEDAQMAVNACYGGIVDWPFFDFSCWPLYEMASGNTAKGSIAGDKIELNQFSNFTFSPSNSAFQAQWAGIYKVLNYCNQAITNIPSIPNMDESKKTELIGEAKFIRAYLYFILVRAFGEVPVFDGLPADQNYNIPKSDLSTVYKLIEKDLMYAGRYCRSTAWPTDQKGRITSWGAQAYLAKVKMYEASAENFTDNKQALNNTTWKNVKDITDKVIDSKFYSLYKAHGDSSFFYLFRLENENCCESIFEAQCGTSSAASGIARSAWAQYEWITKINRFGFNAPSDQLIKDWEARKDDTLRFHQSIAFQGQIMPDGDTIIAVEQSGTSAKGDPAATGIYRSRCNFKAYESANDDKHNADWEQISEQNWRIYRYAEVLLIDAEAEFRLGNLANAVASINEVRARVKETPLTTANITLQKILDERRFELAFENDYYFDLIRTGRAAKILGKNGFIAPKNYFYPIPQNQVDLSNQILKQNKYWR